MTLSAIRYPKIVEAEEKAVLISREVKRDLEERGYHLLRNAGQFTALQLEQFIHGKTGQEAEYNGTSPRVKKSGRVYTSSEIKNFFPLPVHCEMSFLPDPPKTMFFYCKKQSAQGGETPLVDFRKVYGSLDDGLKSRLYRSGVRYLRNYDSASVKRSWDVLKLRTWEDAFQTGSKEEVNRKCAEEGQEAIWTGENKLKIVHTTAAFKPSGENTTMSWYNHIQVFHPLAILREARNIFRFKKDLRSFMILCATTLFTILKSIFAKKEEQGMYCTLGNGEHFSKKEIYAIQDSIWKNMEFLKLNEGDLLVVNNKFMAHGRMPFFGKREIWVSWN